LKNAIQINVNQEGTFYQDGRFDNEVNCFLFVFFRNKALK